VIIPVYNEEQTILQVLRKVYDFSCEDFEKEIIVVDDGSTDKSPGILKSAQTEYGFLFFSHDKNFGKGAAIRTGFEKATGDIITVQDADLEYEPADLIPILAEFKKPETQVVFGSRNINPHKRGYWHFVLGVKILTKIINLLFNANLTDSYTCYKAFRKEALKKIELNSSGFEIEAEITVKFLKAGYKITEVPIDYSPRRFSEGKKIGWIDGYKGFLTIIKIWIKKLP